MWGNQASWQIYHIITILAWFSSFVVFVCFLPVFNTIILVFYIHHREMQIIEGPMGLSYCLCKKWSDIDHPRGRLVWSEYFLPWNSSAVSEVKII